MKPKRVYSAVKTCLEFGFAEQNSNGLFIGLYCAFVSESRSLFAALDDDKSAERSNGGWPDPIFACTCAHKHIPAQDKHSWPGSGMCGRTTRRLAGRDQV